ncbi:scavenger receptor class F member 1-like [Mercenaria mercenaria]|uniref:scavenger receptor class F member 1-like n=1 Tax=Mercenaria mercenaria TaxID=6596 RepID=UPI00234F7F93|nr:scavenger receptor class F member 1-like [Mercenaria mercenaria]
MAVLQGYSSPNCSVECPQNCAATETNDTDVCNAASEECLYGCKDGFYGCKPNYWRGKCQNLCNTNYNVSHDPSKRICDKGDGTCLNGCNNNNYWGNQCDKECSIGCINETCQQESGYCTERCSTKTVYGLFCDKTCGENCLQGTCNREDGYCDIGCVKGKYGNRCDKSCNENCKNIRATETMDSAVMDVKRELSETNATYIVISNVCIANVSRQEVFVQMVVYLDMRDPIVKKSHVTKKI